MQFVAAIDGNVDLTMVQAGPMSPGQGLTFGGAEPPNRGHHDATFITLVRTAAPIVIAAQAPASSPGGRAGASVTSPTRVAVEVAAPQPTRTLALVP